MGQRVPTRVEWNYPCRFITNSELIMAVCVGCCVCCVWDKRRGTHPVSPVLESNLDVGHWQ